MGKIYSLIQRSIVLCVIGILSMVPAFANPEVTNTNPTPASIVGSTFTTSFETPDFIDFEDTSGHVLYKQGLARLQPEALCEYNGEASIPSCWTTVRDVTVDTGVQFKGMNSIMGEKPSSGPDTELYHDPSGSLNYTMEAFYGRFEFDPIRTIANVAMTMFNDLGTTRPVMHFQTTPTQDVEWFDNAAVAWKPTGLTHEGAETAEKWTYVEMNGEGSYLYMIGNNWTEAFNASTSDNYNYIDRADALFMGTVGDKGWVSRILIYNQSPNFNEEDSIIAFETMTFGSSFDQVQYSYTGSSGVELLFTCGGGTPTQKATTTGVDVACSGGSNTQLTAWINLTNGGTVEDLTITTSLTPVVPIDACEYVENNATLLMTFDSSETDDSSPNNNDGTENGNVVIDNSNKVIGTGSAYFGPEDGTDDYIRFSNIAEYTDLQSFSGGCWTNFTESASDSGPNSIMNRQQVIDLNGDFQFNARPDFDQLQFAFRGDTAGDAMNARFIDADIMADNTWKLYGFTCNKTSSSSMSCYTIVNYTGGGVDFTTNSGVISNNADVCIGANCKEVDKSNPPLGFQGALDNCFIVDQALSFGGPGTDWYEIWEKGKNFCPLPGMFGYWPLDEGTGTTTLDAVGSNDGTISGATWTTGNVGNALLFDGTNDGVDLGDIEMDDWDALTVSAWFKTTNDADFQRVVSKDQVGVQGSFIVRFTGTNWEFLLYDPTAPGAASQKWRRAQYTSTAENDGQWHHIVGVLDEPNNLTRLYMDGIEVATAPFTDTTVDDSDNEEVVIGADSDVGAYDRVFDGSIDEVSIFDRTLSAAEVLEMFNAGDMQQNACTLECVDNDGDGFGLFCAAGLDCDDTNSSKQPPVDGMSYSVDTTFCPGTYQLPSGIEVGGVDLNFGDNGDVVFS